MSPPAGKRAAEEEEEEEEETPTSTKAKTRTKKPKKEASPPKSRSSSRSQRAKKKKVDMDDFDDFDFNEDDDEVKVATKPGRGRKKTKTIQKENDEDTAASAKKSDDDDEKEEKEDVKAKSKSKGRPKKKGPGKGKKRDDDEGEEAEEMEDHRKEKTTPKKGKGKDKEKDSNKKSKDYKEKKTKDKHEPSKPKKKAAASPEKDDNNDDDGMPLEPGTKRYEMRYEMKFSENEIVIGLENEESDEPTEKFVVGRLQQDVLLGDHPEDEAKVKWFDIDPDEVAEGRANAMYTYYQMNMDDSDDEEKESDDDDNDNDNKSEGKVSMAAIGSLVCAVSKYCTKTTPVIWKVSATAFDFAEQKLQQQLEDDYASENDSHFGDAAVEKRLEKQRQQELADEKHKTKTPSPASKKHQRSSSKSPRAKKHKLEDDGGYMELDDIEEITVKKSPSNRSPKHKKSTPPPKKRIKKALSPRPFLTSLPDPFSEVVTGRIDSFDGDVERAGKEVVRAVRSGDSKALHAAAKGSAATIIHSLHTIQSVGVPLTPLMWALVDGNVEAAKILLDDLTKSDNSIERAALQSCSLPTLSTGKQASRYSSYNRAKIGASRGGREGNNALLHDTSGSSYKTGNGHAYLNRTALPLSNIQQFAPDMPHMCLIRDFDEISEEVLDLAEATFSMAPRGGRVNDDMLKAGHLHMARRYIKREASHTFSSNSYNFLHLEALSTEPIPKDKGAKGSKEREAGNPFSRSFKSTNVAKKSDTESRFSPLACACINPDTQYLEYLLSVAPEHVDMTDQKQTTLLHYAAACDGPGPLEFLLNKFPTQVSRTAQTKAKEMPIHFAARAARQNNLVALLFGLTEEEKHHMFAARTSDGLAPIHLATQTRRKGNLETVRYLLLAGSDANLATSPARNKVTPVHLAARLGDLPMLRLLLENKGDPDREDKLGRTPLIHACQNGHAHIVTYLVGEIGVDPDAADLSGNHAMHYAAAYGWDDCVSILLTDNKDKVFEFDDFDDFGDDTKKEKSSFTSVAYPDPKNDWKTTPLAVAIQKGRQKVASLLLDVPEVDVNFPDGETGKTLFYQLVEGFVAKVLLLPAKTSTSLVKTSNATDTHETKNKSVRRSSLEYDDDVDVSDANEVATQALEKEMPWALPKLLERKDLDMTVTAPDSGQNVLHLICSQKYPQGGRGEERAVVLAKMILSRASGVLKHMDKLDVDAKDVQGMTALLHTAVSGNTKLMQLLLENGASVSSRFVDRHGKNICHHVLSRQAHLSGGAEMIDLVEKSAGGAKEFSDLLESQDYDGLSPLHCVMKSMCCENQSMKKEEFRRSNLLVKKLVDRFPRSAKAKVGSSKLFSDPAALAKVIAGGDMEELNGRKALQKESADDEGNSWHKRRNSSRKGALRGNDRFDPTKICQALKSRDLFVPIESEDVGKTLVHFACESSYPERVKEMLAWLLLAMPENATIAAGRKCNSRMTPLHILLRDKLANDNLIITKQSGDETEDRRRSMIAHLQNAVSIYESSDTSPSDVNDAPQTIYFPNEPDWRLKYSDAGAKAFTADKDEEACDCLKRLSKACVADPNDAESGCKLLDTFRDLMQAREKRYLANRTQRTDLSTLPLASLLASAGSQRVPSAAWDLLIDKLDLDMEATVSGGSALHQALNSKDITLCEYICGRYPDLVLEPDPSSGDYPIHVVAAVDDPRYVKLVLATIKSSTATEAEAVEAVNQKDAEGRTALHLSVAQAGSRKGEPLEPCEALFLGAGGRLGAQDNKKRTPLHYCFLDVEATGDHFNFPHCLKKTSHDRIDLVSTLLGAFGEESGAGRVLNCADHRGRTPVFYAAAFNATVSSLLMVSKGADLFHKDEDGNTAVNVAVLRGHDSFAITLLKSMGASANIPELVDVVDVRREECESDSRSGVVVKEASRSVHSILWHAIKANFSGLVYILLDSFPAPRAIVDAIDNGAFQLVRKLLSNSSSDVIKFVNPGSGRSLLHEVADAKHYDNPEWSTTLAKLILDGSVSAASRAKDGQTSLHLAAGRGHVDLARLLVGADSSSVNIRDNEGHLPLARFMRTLPNLSLSDHLCSEMLDILTVGIEMFNEKGTNQVPQEKSGVRSFDYDGMKVSPGPNLETVSAEIEKEVFGDMDGTKDAKHGGVKKSAFSTLLVQAVRSNRLPLMQELVNKGADLDLVDSSGLAPLHHAVLQASLPGAALLLRNLADPNVTTDDERELTPLMLAAIAASSDSRNRRNFLEIAKLLLRYGADVLSCCETTGNTALHFSVYENNLEMVELLLHSASDEDRADSPDASNMVEDSKCLVRFGSDTALYPAEVGAETIKVFDPAPAEVPRHCISERFSYSELALDSLESFLELLKGKTTEFKSSAKLHNIYQKKALEHDLFASDSDNDDMPQKKPQEPLDSERRDSLNLLAHYYGLESALVGSDDFNLTSPLEEGQTVLIQEWNNDGSPKYTNISKVWLSGTVVAIHKNRSYDVQVGRGSLMTAVLRQHIRPWKQGHKSKSRKTKSSKSKSTAVSDMLSSKNKDGLTCLQVAVKPLEFGSFENKELVDTLIGAGAIVDERTISLSRPRSKFRKHLISKMGNSSIALDEDMEEPSDTEEDVSSSTLKPIATDEFKTDYKAAMKILEKRGLMNQKKQPPKINSVCEIKAVGLHVLPLSDEVSTAKSCLFYDIAMTKVELTHHSYSRNQYYKMQILRDPSKDLFILLTNWGQIGDYGGEKQETPFGSREEAVKEFTRVFKSKSGNKWEDFCNGVLKPQIGKYKPLSILSIVYEKPEVADIIEIIENAEDHPVVKRDSSLPMQVKEMMRAFVNRSAIASTASSLGFHQERLPLGKLSFDTILAAEEKLAEVDKAIEESQKLKKPEELEACRRALENVAVLSSQYFEMIPTREDDDALKPLDSTSLADQKAKLAALKDLTVASQIVNTASVKAKTINPLDYAYRALNTNIQVLSQSSPIRIGIEQYFRNTCRNKDLVISEVFAIRRFDEPSNADMENHRLLWHGTPVANMMGVLKEGLRVAPPTAQHCGAAFGEGVYFADMASKSWDYCRANLSTKEQPRGYILLADVALGNQERVTTSVYETGAEHTNGDSVMAVGYEGPDATKDVTFAKNGTTIPLGEVVPNPKFKPEATWNVVSGRHRALEHKHSQAIEYTLSSQDTEFPTRVRIEIDSKPFDALLEHGPYAQTAVAIPVAGKRAKKQSSSNGKKKKQKIAENQAHTPERRGDQDESDESDNEEDPSSEEPLQLQRKKESMESRIRFNEYIVRDISRINLKYVVEVTSKSWLKENAKKQRRRRSSVF